MCRDPKSPILEEPNSSISGTKRHFFIEYSDNPEGKKKKTILLGKGKEWNIDGFGLPILEVSVKVLYPWCPTVWVTQCVGSSCIELGMPEHCTCSEPYNSPYLNHINRSDLEISPFSGSHVIVNPKRSKR